MQERDDQIRRLREEAVQAQKRLQQQQDEETAQQAELRERIEHLSLRKEELKQQLEDKEAELEEVKRVYRQVSHHKYIDILKMQKSALYIGITSCFYILKPTQYPSLKRMKKCLLDQIGFFITIMFCFFLFLCIFSCF